MIAIMIAYVATAVVFLLIDAVWLTMTANTLYRPILGDIMAPVMNIVPAIIFYVLFVAGIVIFAVTPAMTSGRWQTALIYGALFGFFAYATYDLTNQATLRNWSTLLTVMDLAWGSFVTAAAATLGYLISTTAAKALGV